MDAGLNHLRAWRNTWKPSLIWIQPRQGTLIEVQANSALRMGNKFVLNQRGESNSPKPHSKVYEDGMGLLFILGSALVLIVVIYVLGYFE